MAGRPRKVTDPTMTASQRWQVYNQRRKRVRKRETVERKQRALDDSKQSIREAIITALDELTKRKAKPVLRSIAIRLINQSLAGKAWAIRELFDRLEGRPAQNVSLSRSNSNNNISLALDALKSMSRAEAKNQLDRAAAEIESLRRELISDGVPELPTPQDVVVETYDSFDDELSPIESTKVG